MLTRMKQPRRDPPKAQTLLDARVKQGEHAFAQLRVVRVPEPVRGSRHLFKYSLVYVVDGQCVLRFDNEAGKGDHCHVGTLETSYTFITIDHLLADFWRQVDDLEAMT